MTNEELDRILDGALAAYTQEPRAGLEQRVLNRVRSSGMARRFSRPAWVFALAIAACAALFMLRRPTPPPPQLPLITHATELPPPLTPPLTRPSVPRRAATPRQAVFPAPAQMTAGERALVALFQRHPDLTIEALDIAPLETEHTQ